MTNNTTPTQDRLNSDFAALFGPVTPPATLPPELLNGTQTSERLTAA